MEEPIQTNLNPSSQQSQDSKRNSQANSESKIRKSFRFVEQQEKYKQPKENILKSSLKLDPSIYQSDESSDSEKEQKEEKNEESEKENLQQEIEVITHKQSKHSKFRDDIVRRENQAESISIDFVIQVDEDCDVQNVKVVDDYSCKLTLVDITYNNLNQNKFYKIQLLERNDKKKWFLWCQYGRINSDNPVTKVNEFYNKFDALAAFETRFFERTGNKWVEKSFFQQKPGKWTLVQSNKEKEVVQKFVETESELIQTIQSSYQTYKNEQMFSQETIELLEKIWNIDLMKKVMTDLGLDLEKLPFGRLTNQQIVKGFRILSEIQKLLLIGQSKENALNTLSMDFYQAIPHNFGVKKPVMIEHLLRVKEKTKLLETLQHLAIQQNCLLNSLQDFKNIHPLSIYYKLLTTNIQPIYSDNKIYELIERGLTNTHAESHNFSLKLKNVFELNKASEQLNFLPYQKSLHNKFLLWHGIKQNCLASVIREGLKIVPQEAPSTCYILGKGLYFTDCSSKAANQSLGGVKGTTDIYLILSEVALGNMHKVFKPSTFKKPPTYSHSVYGVGQQKPKLIGIKDLNSKDQESFMPSEVSVCSPHALFFNTGKLVANPDISDLGSGLITSDLKFNDFVIYDESQVRLRYLVQCECVNE